MQRECGTCGKPIDNGLSSWAYCSWECNNVALAKLYDPTKGQRPMSPTRPPESSNERAERAWIYDKVAHRYRGMTIDQFIVRLEKTPRDWFLEGAAIRRPSEDRMVRPYNCPLTAVGCWPNEMETLVALEIMHAADASYGYDAGLRERLLTACELTKGPTNA